MALGNRLTTQMDITGNVDGLQRLLTALGNDASKFAATLAKAGGDTSGIQKTSRSLGVVLKQAQQLQTVLDAIQGKKGAALLGDLDTQRLGRNSAAVGKIRQEFEKVSTASQVFDRRLVDINKRFADLNRAGRVPNARDLSKQFKIEQAKRDLEGLERQLRRLDTTALLTPSKGQSPQIRQIREELDRAYQSLQRFASKGTTFNFTDRINGISVLQAKFKELIALENAEAKANSARAIQARETARKIIEASEAERAAALRRSSSNFAYPNVTYQRFGETGLLERQSAAEQRLAENVAKRLRLVNMINAAQARGAPVRSIERLNTAYASLEQKLAADLALIKQINRELNNTPAAKSRRINEYLFGDGGAAFTKRIAGAAVIGSGVFAVINAVQSGIRFIIDFEDELKQLQAISGSTDRQMQKMAESIAEVGRESKFSTLEIAKAATIIAQAGFAANELEDVLKGSVTLSTASGSTPDQAVDTLTSALGAFRLQASETERVVDSIVTALNRTKLTIEQVQLAIQYVGATAKQSNVDLNELLTITGALAQAGIKRGSVIGTGLRQQLVQFSNPSKEMRDELDKLSLTIDDIDVKSKSYIGVVKTLTDAGFSAAQAYETLGIRAAASFIAIQNQIDVYDELALAIARGGSAQEAQEKALDSVNSQWQILLNTLGEILSTVAGPLTDLLKVTLKGINALLAPIADFTNALETMAQSSEGATFIMRGLTGALLGFWAGGPIGAVIGGVLALVSSFGALGSQTDEVRTKVMEAAAAYDSQVITIQRVDETITKLIERQDILTDNSTDLAVETINLSQQFKDLQTEILETEGSYQKLLDTMIQYGREQRILQGELAREKQRTAGEALDVNFRRLRQTGDVSASAVGIQGRRNDFQRRFVQAQNTSRESILANPTQFRIVLQRLMEDIRRNPDDRPSAYSNQRLADAIEQQLDIFSEIESNLADMNLANRQINIAGASTTDEFVAFENRIIAARQQIASDKLDSANRNLEQIEKEIMAVLERNKGNQDVLAAYNSLLRQTRAAKVGARGEDDPTLTGEDKATTGTPRTDIEAAAAFARAEGFKVGRVGRNGVSRGAGHKTGRAVDINVIAGVDADDRRARAKLDALAVKYQKAGYTVLWNGKWYKPDGSIAAIPKAWGDHRDHLHVEAPDYGVTVGGLASISEGTTAAEQRVLDQQERDRFSLAKARASNRVGAAEATISTIIKEAKAGTYGPDQLRARLEVALDEFIKASLNKFDVDNPTDDLTKDALTERTLAREELQKTLKEKVAGFNADLARRISDYASDLFDAAMDLIEADFDNAVFAAEEPVRETETQIERANTPLNQRRNSDDGTQYYLRKRSFNSRLTADQDILGARQRSEQARQAQIDLLTQEAVAYPQDQQAGEAYLDIQKKISEATQELNEYKRETLALQESINARTQEYVALPLNQRLREGVTAWAEQSGVMNTYEDVLANNVVPALNVVTDGMTNMISSLISGQATLKEALGSMIQSIADFVTQLIARALALMAIKWFLRLIGVELVDGPGGVTLGKIAGQMKGGPAGEPAKFMSGGSTRPYISQGVSNRDGVPAYLARGEYVVRKNAVDSMSVPVMDRINQFGAKALDGMGSSPIMMGGNEQNMNVYIVAPEEKPQLGPNDVLAIISNDVLRGGTTKKLIKSVSNG